jgi:hypothetical protein
LWGWTVDNFQLSETVLKGRTGRGGSRRLGQLRKLRVSRPQASLCAGACVCVRAHHSCGSGLPASRAPAPDRRSLCAGRARSSSTLGFTTWRAVRRLTQVLRGRGAKRGELRGAACAGQGRASRARRGVRHKGLRRTPPCIGACAWQLTLLRSMFNATFGEDQRSAFGDYLELAMQSQYNKRNL